LFLERITNFVNSSSKRFIIEDSEERNNHHEMKYVITIHPPAGKAYGGGVRPNLAQFHLDEKLALNSPLANTIILISRI